MSPFVPRIVQEIVSGARVRFAAFLEASGLEREVVVRQTAKYPGDGSGEEAVELHRQARARPAGNRFNRVARGRHDAGAMGHPGELTQERAAGWLVTGALREPGSV